MQPRHRLRVFLLGWLILSIASALWAVATPIGGAPDEPGHIIKAASVVRGEFIGKNGADGQIVHVPAYIAYTPAQTCYAYNQTVEPSCAAPFTGDPWKTVTSSTSAGLYNPVYYLLVGWPSLIAHDDSGVYAMRIVAGVVTSLFLAFALMLISTWRRRRIPLIAFAAAATPMVFFLNGVINPNSLETTATLAAFVGVLSIVSDPRPELLTERAMITLASAAVAVNTRGLSPLWVAVALLAPFLLASWPQIRELARNWSVRIAFIGIALATGAALAWTLLTNSLGAGLTPAVGNGVGVSPLRGFAQVFAGTFDYGHQIVGVFGWLDTAAPSVVYFVWCFFIGALALGALVLLRGRPLALSLALIASLLLLPPIAQALYVSSGGIVWQGRYALALFVITLVGLGTALTSAALPLAPARFTEATWRRLVVIVLALWAFCQFYSFEYALKRYGVGLGGTSWKVLLTNPVWSPPGGTVLLTVSALIVAAVGGVLLVRLALARDASSQVS